MPIYVYQDTSPTYHEGLEMMLFPGENDIPADKVDLADRLPYLRRVDSRERVDERAEPQEPEA
jgi:hypothetical protein